MEKSAEKIGLSQYQVLFFLCSLQFVYIFDSNIGCSYSHPSIDPETRPSIGGSGFLSHCIYIRTGSAIKKTISIIGPFPVIAHFKKERKTLRLLPVYIIGVIPVGYIISRPFHRRYGLV